MKTLIRRNVRSAMLSKRILKEIAKLNQNIAVLASAVKRLEEENKNLVAEIVALKNTKEETTIIAPVTVEMARLALKWLQENEIAIQKKHKNFVYKYNYLAKQMRVRSVILEDIANGWSDDARVDMKIKRIILKFAQKMGYVGANE